MNPLRILWCLQSLPFQKNGNGYGGGGWIASLLKKLVNRNDLAIGIAYYGEKRNKESKSGNITLYSLLNGNLTFTERTKVLAGDFSGWIREEEEHLTALEGVIKDFKPDIIHVWGTETDFGLIASKTSIPVVLHLQGIHNSIYNALLPPGFSNKDFLKGNGCSLRKIVRNYSSLCYWKYKCEREIRIFHDCRNYLGRTNFDKHVSQYFSPDSRYFYCGEMLRHEFSGSNKVWHFTPSKSIRLVSVISSPLYKGVDVILKTAKLLNGFCHKIEWNVVGIGSADYVEKRLGVKASDCNVRYCGIMSAEQIRELDLSSHIFVHPSYIDNSPNSVCEAQILGMPVIASHVGGVSSIVENGKTGMLVPANDPYQTASLIIQLYNNRELSCMLSKNSINSAKSRHDENTIIETLVSTYKLLTSK